MTADSSGQRTILVLSVCGFASTFAMRFVDPMVGEISRDLSRPAHDVALLASAFALPYALVQPVLGPVGDALGKERIIKICLVVMAVTLALASVMPDLDSLLVLRVLSGAAGGGIIPLVLATIGDRVPMAERQVAISRFLLFSITGQLLGGSLSGVLTAWIGWRGVFGLAGLLGAVATVAACVGLRHARPASGRFSVSVAARRYASILAMPRARALFAFVFIEGGIIFGVQPYLAPLLEERGLGGAAQAGIMIACFAAGGMAYTLSVRALLRVLGLRRMLVTAGAFAAGAFLVLAAGPAWPIQAAAMLLVGIGFYMLHNSYQTQVTELTAEARGSAVSLHAFSYFLGQAIGAPVTGAGLVYLGVVPTLAIGAAGVLALGVVSALILFPRQRAR
jgi:predicted MFS family arabinose efflux permease